jgi:hypothetical protein
MILEAIVRINNGRMVVETGDTQRTIVREEKHYDVLSGLKEGDKVFINPTSSKRCLLVTNFDSDIQDWCFQRMFGNKIPYPVKDLNSYQKRLLEQTTRYRH